MLNGGGVGLYLTFADEDLWLLLHTLYSVCLILIYFLLCLPWILYPVISIAAFSQTPLPPPFSVLYGAPPHHPMSIIAVLRNGRNTTWNQQLQASHHFGLISWPPNPFCKARDLISSGARRKRDDVIFKDSSIRRPKTTDGQRYCCS